MSDRTPVLEGLSREEKLALLKRLAAEKAARAKPRPSRWPLSFQQQRLWFLDQLDPGGSFNNIPRALRLEGSLNTAALEAGLQRIVERHEALRSRFPDEEGEAVQVVEPAGRRPLPVVDLSGLDPASRDAGGSSLVQSEALKGFDLASGPVLRTSLLRLGGREHLLLFNVHHIAFDGWSLGLFFSELALAYGMLAEGGEADLPKLTLQYGDYAHWQRQHYQGEALESLVDYWRQRLEGAETVLELPTDRPRPPVETYAGAVLPRAFRPELGEAVAELARRRGATLFMALTAGFAGLLQRYSRQRDLLLGAPIANRSRPELENLIGFFANTLVLRVSCDGDPTTDELLERVKETCLGAFTHQEMPFERLVEEVQPERDLSRNPLFQAMFALHNVPPAGFGLPGLETRLATISRKLSKVDLTLDIYEAGGALQGYFEYNTDLFDEATIERLAGHLGRLLEGMAAHPELPLDGLPLLEAGERSQLVDEWSRGPEAGASSVEPTVALHQLFEAQVNERGDAPAVIHGGGEVSYRELDLRANRLARRLAARGVGPEVPVGIFTGRGLETVVSFLAVLKAGGAYVPLDVDHPAARISFLVADTGMPLLLTVEAFADRLPEGLPAEVVVLEREADAIAAESPLPLDLPVDGESTAYRIYTSGSTGRPKGVAIPHRAIVHHARAIARRYGQGPEDRVLQFASPTFDVAGEEIYPTLATGGALVLRGDDLSLVLADFLVFVERQGISVLNLPTPYWHEWASQPSQSFPRPPQSLRLVVVGTEGALAERLADWQRRLAEASVRVEWINSYGPTEATITATAWSDGGPGDGDPRREDLWRVPIGRAVGDARAHVLDGQLEPTPVGVPGHLHLAGPGLARGYHGRPAETAAAFVPDPFSAQAGGRLYRSGDLARWKAPTAGEAGELEFLGRIDQDQVKIRGFRIELGEVQDALASLSAVRDCTVVAGEEKGGNRRLVAYAVPADGEAPTPEGLRRGLSERLPGYMVPAAFVLLEALPLNASGKVDRRALPEPESLRRALATDFVAPRGPVEEVVAAIWSEVLDAEEIGAHDDFFDLGGHSLLATRIASRLRGALQREVPVRSLFEHPTVATLADALSREPGEADAGPPLAPRPREGELPLSFAQQRLWFLDQLEPGSPAYNLAAPVRFDGALRAADLAAALTAVVGRHEALRTTFVDRHGKPAQQIAEQAAVSLPSVDLSGLAEEDARRHLHALAVADALRPFDLAAGPLLRACLVRVGDAEHVLLLNQHHIISDGWSTDLLLKELLQLYRAAGEARQEGGDADLDALLPPLPLQYADFAAWQREALSGARLEAQLEFWRDELGDASRALELPTDRPRPAVPSYRGERRYLTLDEARRDGLERLARERGATLFMVLLGAFQALLHRYSGHSDLCVGTPIAGRNRQEIEGVIGFFVNTLVLRAQLAGAASFETLLAQVRERALGAYAHQEVPFEHLVDELQPERDLSRNPLFQAFFTLQNVESRAAVTPSELRVGVLSLDNRTSRFDLALTAWKSPAGVDGFFEYALDLFDPSTIERMGGHFQRLVDGILEAPTAPLAALPLLSPGEERQLLVEWNATEETLPEAPLVHRLFAWRAAEEPQRPAIRQGGDALSYGELEARSNRLARHLLAAGLGAEELVGIYMERRLDLMVALLGVLKAGGAYLPLDPTYPAERLGFMLSDSGAPFVLTHEDLLDGLPAAGDDGPRPICLDRDAEAIAAWDDGALGRPVDGRQLAYVLYTSGSTGRPKGVQIPHRALTNFLLSMAAEPGFTAEDRLLAVTTLSFDIAGLELYLPLIQGGSIELADARTAADGEALGRLLKESGVTVMQATPATWRLLLDAGWYGEPRLRALCGGEALPAELAQRLVAACGELWNVYGPTETTIWSTRERIRPSADEAAPPISIGRPLANTTLYLLDRLGAPTPIGVPGELLIGGAGLARGYFGRPALTAQRFVPHGHARRPGERLYRTGDLARCRADGRLEFQGRLDHQVKVRGFRIELGEIETALERHPGVGQAVVTAQRQEIAGGEPLLVAYLVAAAPEAGGEPTPGLESDALRAHLRQSLPEYMVPAIFMPLEAMPLTPNGKVDRKALPAPQREVGGARNFVAPRNSTEERIAEVWRQVLGAERISVDDNFFELGGHSLLATQVVSRLAREHHFEIELRTLFDAPTVAGLAEAVQASEFESADSELLAQMLAELEGNPDEKE